MSYQNIVEKRMRKHVENDKKIAVNEKWKNVHRCAPSCFKLFFFQFEECYGASIDEKIIS